MSKSEEVIKIAEMLSQLSTRLTYWAEFALAFEVGNLAEEITLLAGGLRVEEAGKVALDLEERRVE